MIETKESTHSKRSYLRTFVFVFIVFSVVLTVIFISSSRKSSYVMDLSTHLTSNFSSIYKQLMTVERMNALKANTDKNGTVLKNETGPIQTIRNEDMFKEESSTTLDSINIIVKDTKEEFNTTENQTRMNKSDITTMQYNVFGNPLINGVTDDTRQDECHNCFNHNFKYVIDNPDICKLYSDQTEIELMLIILTVHENVQQRNTLRETWLTHSKNNTASVRYAFLLGEVKDEKLKADVIKEGKIFRDIIKEDFVDVYSNLTYKTIMGFKWTATKCKVAKAVMKTDDDMYINVPNVLKIVRNKFTDLQTNVIGSCAQVASPIRDQQSKWFASLSSYPGKFYPGFCSGTGYMTSFNVARKVFEISPHVPYFHLEDVYVALCIKKLGYHLKGFPGFNPGRPNLDACLYNGNSLLTAHYMTPAMIRQIWGAKCPSLPS